jgi:hypothetical protein
MTTIPTMAQSLAAVALISILWVAFEYSLVFAGDGPWLGTLRRAFLAGMNGVQAPPPSAALSKYRFAARLLGKVDPALAACPIRKLPCRAFRLNSAASSCACGIGSKKRGVKRLFQ